MCPSEATVEGRAISKSEDINTGSFRVSVLEDNLFTASTMVTSLLTQIQEDYYYQLNFSMFRKITLPSTVNLFGPTKLKT